MSTDQRSAKRARRQEANSIGSLDVLLGTSGTTDSAAVRQARLVAAISQT